MKITLWNVERASTGNRARMARVQARMNEINTEILILTEASQLLTHPDLPYRHSSEAHLVPDQQLLTLGHPATYKPDEVRSMILSRYPVTPVLHTANPLVTCCADVEAPDGTVRVIATILGVLYRENIWKRDFEALTQDLANLGSPPVAPNLVVAGDFNLALHQSQPGEPANWTKKWREPVQSLLAQYGLHIPGERLPKIIDFIALRGLPFQSHRESIVTSVLRNLSDHPLVDVSA